jgi:hypothetical protein
MTTLPKESLNQLLDKVGEELDIPDHVYEDAVVKYEAVGEWLDAEDSPLKKYKPEIFPQGSFRLGTAVRPYNDSGEYDIDLVCHLTIEKDHTTQAELKDRVGNRLKADSALKEILEESRRCWRLNYSGQFHLDVLPVIPNAEQPPSGILLTDTDLHHWQKSNPKGYADWFYRRMAVFVVAQKEAILKAEAFTYKSIEEVEEWKVRTPLQRAVQLLKRHRDIYFADDYENCPVSIILTTLAAKAYNNQDNIIDAIIGMVRDMPKFIELREDGRWWVENPAEPGENFADKWNENPARRNAFLIWLRQVQIDFERVLSSTSFKEASDQLSDILGKSDVSLAAKAFGPTNTALALVRSRTPQVPPLANTRHVLGPEYPEKKLYSAQVRGTVHRGRSSWPLSERSVPKDVRLKFTLHTNAPQPFTVRWQVANTGFEAEQANQLRGDFYDSDPTSQLMRWEHTGFSGTHWVEVFVIKDGATIARSGKKMVRVRSGM